MSQQFDTQTEKQEGTFSKIGSGILDCVEGVLDALVVPSTSNRTDCDKLVSDLFWYSSYGPLGPTIRDFWFGDK